MNHKPEARPTAAKVLSRMEAGIKANTNFQNARDAFYFLRAAAKGESRELTSLLESNAELIHVKAGSDGKSALHQAPKSKNPLVSQILIAHGANVSALDNNHETPLHCAAVEGSEETVATLLNHGADIQFDKRGWTAIHVAAATDHHAVISEFIKQRKERTDEPSQDQKGLTPLHIAARNGCTTTLECLLSAGADVNRTTSDGAMAFHLGAENGHTQILECLRKSKAEVGTSNKDKYTALHLAALNGHVETAEYLLNKNSKIESRNRDGETAFHCAAREGRSKVIELLAVKGADTGAKVTGSERYEWTALHLASSKGQEGAVETLLALKVQVNERNADGNTALHYAAKRGNVGIAQRLLNHKAKVNIKGYDNRPPLHWAAISGQTEMVNLLVKNGAEPNQRTGSGDTALMLAASKGYNDTVTALLSHTITIDTVNKKGDTALHLAVRARQSKVGVNVVETLLCNGAKVNVANCHGQTPLMSLMAGKKDLSEAEVQIKNLLKDAVNSSR